MFSLSFNANSEFNPATLKFRNVEKSCPRHRKKPSFLLSNNKFLGIFPKPKFMFNSSFSSSSASYHRKGTNASSNLIANGGESSANLKANLIDDLNQANCVQCMAEDNSYNHAGLTREQLFNQQAAPFFKYFVLMSCLIFVSIMAVLLISDLKK